MEIKDENCFYNYMHIDILYPFIEKIKKISTYNIAIIIYIFTSIAKLYDTEMKKRKYSITYSSPTNVLLLAPILHITHPHQRHFQYKFTLLILLVPVKK